MGVAQRRPRSVHIIGEENVLAELQCRAPQRGMRKALAQDAGVSLSLISQVAHRQRPMPPSLAYELGFRLAWVRDEELALAAKIEAEINSRPMLKDDAE